MEYVSRGGAGDARWTASDWLACWTPIFHHSLRNQAQAAYHHPASPQRDPSGLRSEGHKPVPLCRRRRWSTRLGLRKRSINGVPKVASP